MRLNKILFYHIKPYHCVMKDSNNAKKYKNVDQCPAKSCHSEIRMTTEVTGDLRVRP